MAGNRLDSVKGRSLMSKQINKFTAVALGAAGAGAALALTNKHRQENAKRENLRSGGTAEYRNTERGKSEKTAKGSATPPAIMKRSSARKSPKAWKKNTPTS